VGTELLELLASRQFPLASLKLLASERSAGKTLNFQGESLLIEAVNERSFQDVDIVLASAGGSTSKAWAKTIVESGATIIDNSSAFRMNPEVPWLSQKSIPTVWTITGALSLIPTVRQFF